MEQFISNKTLIFASPDQVSTEVNGEAVILDLNDGVYYGLDSIGMRLWQMIQQPIAFEDLISAVVAEFEVEPDDCRKDVLAWLDEMAAQDLISMKYEPTG